MLILFVILLSNFAEAQNLEVVTWNIEKGADANWKNFVFENTHVDYWGIQEATDTTQKDFLNLTPYTYYNSAWRNYNTDTGTLSASIDSQNNLFKVVTNVSEPLLRTPKSFIVSDLNSDCVEPVKIVNTHMINFKLGGSYKKQLLQMSEYIKNHSGPLIVLGDFNNWNFLRTRTLKKWLDSHNLRTHIDNDKIDRSSIDHIFYRGLTLLNYKKYNVGLSDHEPIKAEFECITSDHTNKATDLN